VLGQVGSIVDRGEEADGQIEPWVGHVDSQKTTVDGQGETVDG
jgi:hypothetical protein